MLHNITISFCKNALKITKPWPRDGETCWGPVPKIYTNFEETLSCAHVKFWRIKRGLGVFHNYYYLLILQLLLYIIILFSLAATAPQWALASSFTRFVFLDHKQRHTTVGRTPLNEWSVRRRDLYLTTHPPEVWSVPPVTPCIYGVMISRWMGWAGNVAECRGDKEYMKFTFRKFEGKATRWCSWLRHGATSNKVVGSNPMMSSEFPIDTVLPDTLWPWGWLNL